MRFYLGVHRPNWLRDTTTPLFVSDRWLRTYRKLPRAVCRWALDSGGFSELEKHGGWHNGPTPAEYAARVRRYREEVGRLDWAAPQDWMCEPFMVAKTGLSVAEHQRRTVGNYLDLKGLGPDLPIAPVLQGWDVSDYERCADLYATAGVDLTTQPVVGLGSVCRRQGTKEAAHIITVLHDRGIRTLHGFGFKTLGLPRVGHLLGSADSMAWSANARRNPACGRLDRRTGLPVKNCANCLHYAETWCCRVTAKIPAWSQLELWNQGEVA